MAILANTQYTELSVDTTLTAIEGKQYIIKNTGASNITLTYGSDTAIVCPGCTATFIYVGSDWIYTVNITGSFTETEALNVTTDTTLTAVEGKQYYIKNTDTSTHTITYGTDTTTLQQDYTGIFYYVNSAWVYIGAFDKNGNTVIGGNLSALGAITGATSTPSLYAFYDQEPMESDPATLFTGTTWENVSSRSVFYHLSATLGGAESDVVVRDVVEHDNGGGTWTIDKEYAYTDLAVDDQIGGTGTHAGKYVIEVDTFAGCTKRYEGGYAETFEGGGQSHASQRSISEWAGVYGATGQSGSGEINTVETVANQGGAGINGVYTLTLDNAGQTGQTYNAIGDGDGNEGSNPGENRMDNYTIKKWRRVS